MFLIGMTRWLMSSMILSRSRVSWVGRRRWAIRSIAMPRVTPRFLFWIKSLFGLTSLMFSIRAVSNRSATHERGVSHNFSVANSVLHSDAKENVFRLHVETSSTFVSSFLSTRPLSGEKLGCVSSFLPLLATCVVTRWKNRRALSPKEILLACCYLFLRKEKVREQQSGCPGQTQQCFVLGKKENRTDDQAVLISSVLTITQMRLLFRSVLMTTAWDMLFYFYSQNRKEEKLALIRNWHFFTWHHRQGHLPSQIIIIKKNHSIGKENMNLIIAQHIFFVVESNHLQKFDPS